MSKKLQKAARRVWGAFLKFGPVDDGRPEGHAFDAAISDLMRAEIESRYDEENGNTPDKRKIAALKELLTDVCDLLEDIRYVNWPVSGLGIGMTPHRIDSVLTPVQQHCAKRKRKNA